MQEVLNLCLQLFPLDFKEFPLDFIILGLWIYFVHHKVIVYALHAA